MKYELRVHIFHFYIKKNMFITVCPYSQDPYGSPNIGGSDGGNPTIPSGLTIFN